MKCTKCKSRLLQKADNGATRVRIKGAVEVTREGICKAQCFWCGEPVEIPMALTPPVAEEARFVVRPRDA